MSAIANAVGPMVGIYWYTHPRNPEPCLCLALTGTNPLTMLGLEWCQTMVGTYWY